MADDEMSKKSEPGKVELAETSTSSSFQECSLSFGSNHNSMRSPGGSGGNEEEDDDVALQWAAIERLPTMRRQRMSLFDKEEGSNKKVVDVKKLGSIEKRVFIDKVLTKIEEDNLELLKKLKKRVDKVGLELPTVEVRYENLSVEAEYEVVHGKPLPTLWNSITSVFSDLTSIIGCKSQVHKIKILKNISGIVKPSRLTLLLGPPGCGKTTLLKALAGKLQKSLKINGEVSYNGYTFKEFIPHKTSAYISQYDQHTSEMTVRETLDFAARCQGVGGRADIMKEISKREKQVGIIPEPDVDTYMKAISLEGLKHTLQTDYILKILGLDICAETIVGDAMKRGISGGQKKRVTTGEMIVGPTRALFMDEISNGLDSSTTFQILTCMQHLTHITECTILVALLQPAPETFDLFDDIILMAEGKILYNGPRTSVLEFFELCGFRCPARKGVADFLQEVVSKKDQAQYWYHKDNLYNYVSVENFVSMFKQFHIGQKLDEELSRPFNKSEHHKDALAFSIYSVKKWDLFRACMAKEWLLMKRNSFVHVFKTAQLVVVASIAMTIFIRTRMKIDITHATYFMGSLFYALIRLMANGIAELSFTVSRLPVFYKQRDFYFYPAWAYSIPAVILKIPFSFLDAFLWTSLTYYVIGYSPEPKRFFSQMLLLFLLHQVAISMFRLIASVVRTPSIATICSLLCLLFMYLFGGFVIPKPSMPAWLGWCFWLSPLSYAEIGASVNEFLAPRWQKVSSSNTTLGDRVLNKRGLHFDDYFYWISIGALVGFWIIFNVGFTCALSYMKPPGSSRRIISHEKISSSQGSKNSKNREQQLPDVDAPRSAAQRENAGMILPFEPVSITFENVQYFVDTPKKLREQGFQQKRLQLLQDITGAFRPGILTALMGVSGAGKTTLMDVLSGRKTSGTIKGEIRVGGYPKVQATYSRVSGYCEQSDIHSPQITVEESITYSAWLRLPAHIDKHTRAAFVAEVLQLIELDEIKDELVGIPAVSGISSEQRKRLTVAVELVSNPSIIFMDEPTSGLDARAAAIVMRVVKNIVNTNRTVVCTIHQPSIHIFEAFDELILMKRGGQMIYSGELGQNSNKLIEYFESIPGVPKIKENYNPATWMLEVTNSSVETKLNVNFAQLYNESELFRKNAEAVKELSIPGPGTEKLHFPTRYAQNGWEQFRACLWKQNISYWRSTRYNLSRLLFIIGSSLLFGAVLWQKGQKIHEEQDIFNIMGPLFILMQFMGIGNCSSILPIIAAERNVVYRERFAGMYSSWAYSFAQLTIEIPYVLLQAVMLAAITYPAIGFYGSVYKIFWYFYTIFWTLTFFTYFGMLLAASTPTFQVASVFASFFYTMLNLFSGYIIPEPRFPKWWVWGYWICPNAWTLKALLTSQYGDINKDVLVYGVQEKLTTFLKSYYGFKYDDLWIVAIVLIAFPLASALGFAYAIAKINFQKR